MEIDCYLYACRNADGSFPADPDSVAARENIREELGRLKSLPIAIARNRKALVIGDTQAGGSFAELPGGLDDIAVFNPAHPQSVRIRLNTAYADLYNARTFRGIGAGE